MEPQQQKSQTGHGFCEFLFIAHDLSVTFAKNNRDKILALLVGSVRPSGRPRADILACVFLDNALLQHPLLLANKIVCFGKNYGLDFPMLAMDVALSPMRSQELDSMTTDGSPMIINMTPTAEQDGEEDAMKELDSDQQYEKPPPLHTGADWKIVLHLPEIETWLRMTSERVRDLTYSVQQDSDSKHVDVHLVQLKLLMFARQACWDGLRFSIALVITESIDFKIPSCLCPVSGYTVEL
ncbi:A-kinase anchor protein 6 [Chelonia mydas]|uniref:A-kinase anchor protein 6 n=1 Tax=Chelonia mydas TaxID=8469 RepID=M7BF83_CHEMY|nr:A-kinase anchor protein 6 [Chelonia mydas]